MNVERAPSNTRCSTQTVVESRKPSAWPATTLEFSYRISRTLTFPGRRSTDHASTESLDAQKVRMFSTNGRELQSYVIALELEVDRLRRTHDVIQSHVGLLLRPVLAAIQPIRASDQASALVAELDSMITGLAELFRDLRQPPGYHPALDQVVAIAVRPIVEQVFKAQQRLLAGDNVTLHLELATDYMEWFPVRLRHILDSLISNAIRFRDTEKGETRVQVSLRTSGSAYELRVSDNGVGFSNAQSIAASDLAHRMHRPHQLCVGLAVVKLLIEESGGEVTVVSGEGQGSSIVVSLPRFDKGDFLEEELAQPST